jgi:hypothetical protein
MCPCNPETGYLCDHCRDRALDRAIYEALEVILRRPASAAGQQQTEENA